MDTILQQQETQPLKWWMVTWVPSLSSGAHTLHAYVSIGHTCVMQTALVSPVEPPQSFPIIFYDANEFQFGRIRDILDVLLEV